MIKITDHQNFHFGLFCIPNQHSITRKLLQNSPFFLITLYYYYIIITIIAIILFLSSWYIIFKILHKFTVFKADISYPPSHSLTQTDREYFNIIKTEDGHSNFKREKDRHQN